MVLGEVEVEVEAHEVRVANEVESEVTAKLKDEYKWDRMGFHAE